MRRQLLPKSLIQRLALLANGQLALAAGGFARPRRRQGARASTLFFFSLGALMSSVLGGVTLLGLNSLNAGEARALFDGVVAPATIASGWEAAPDIVDIAVERSERAHTALSLRVEVEGGNEDAEVVLRGIPETARLSKGERRDEAWVVKRADLDGLHLTLGGAGPDAFDLQIDVRAPSGAAARAGVVRIRLVDAPAPKHAAAETGSEPPQDKAGPGEAPHKDAATAETSIAKLLPTGAPDAGARAKVTRPPPRKDANHAGEGTTPGARAWPEGASGLGAVSRDSERQVWWSMPPPAWSPFGTD